MQRYHLEVDSLCRRQHSGRPIRVLQDRVLDLAHSNSLSSLLIRDIDSRTIWLSCEIVWAGSSHRVDMLSSLAYNRARTISNIPSSRTIRSYSQTLIHLGCPYSRQSTIHRLHDSSSSRQPRYVEPACISYISL
jgi:hypothetical protein